MRKSRLTVLAGATLVAVSLLEIGSAADPVADPVADPAADPVAGRVARPGGGNAAVSIPTYSRDIAPLFRKRCENCHREGEVAPMSLLNYKELRPWLKSIREEVLESKSMPPWSADPRYGKFSNDPTLTKKELDTIRRWIDGGAPKGDAKDLPAAGEWPEGWQIGKPDVVLEMPEPFKVKANGVIPYKYFTVQTNFKEDRWIERAECRPGNREVVHHIIVFIMNNETRRGLRRGGGGLWANYVVGTAPGEEPLILSPGSGRKIPAGSSIVFQMHYTPIGEEVEDRSKIGLIFSRSPVREEVKTRAVMNYRIRIPPHEANYMAERSSKIFKEDVTLTSLMPHMHLRGKSFEYRLIDPAGKTTTLLSVPEYKFDWQHVYRLEKPLQIKAGSRIHCVASFDNSRGNAANPNPDKTVRWGDQTWDEMMIGFYTETKKLGNGPFFDPLGIDPLGSDPLGKPQKSEN